ncbi:MAG TPA: phospholipase D-like domain-containing protein, partial [Candidatus Absconditabacterales bacterium]|nr:phospholipase D-like domain-containing protein [Candidatus Absconditabacterales bacterium]
LANAKSRLYSPPCSLTTHHIFSGVLPTHHQRIVSFFFFYHEVGPQTRLRWRGYLVIFYFFNLFPPMKFFGKKWRRPTGLIFLAGCVLRVIDFFQLASLELKSGEANGHTEIVTTDQLSGEYLSGLVIVTGELLSSPKKSFPRRNEIVNRQNHLDGWIYSITDDKIKKTLQMVASKNGIRLIAENKIYQGSKKEAKKLVDFFEKAGIDYRSDDALGTNFVHAKTFIGDQDFIIQTANLTHSSFENNREFFFVSKNPIIKKNLEELFAQDRNGTTLKPEEIHPNLLFCPIDCRAKIETLLQSAQKSILIYNQYITDDRLLEIIKTKTHLPINIILTDDDDNQKLLDYFGEKIIKLIKKMRIHAKMILVDDRFLVLSSINFSANSMDNNREIGIILTDPTLISSFKKIFYSDWNS